MFVPTLQIRGPDGRMTSIIGRMFVHPLTRQTFMIVQDPHPPRLLGPQDIAIIMQVNWPATLGMLQALNG